MNPEALTYILDPKFLQNLIWGVDVRCAGVPPALQNRHG